MAEVSWKRYHSQWRQKDRVAEETWAFYEDGKSLTMMVGPEDISEPGLKSSDGRMCLGGRSMIPVRSRRERYT